MKIRQEQKSADCRVIIPPQYIHMHINIRLQSAGSCSAEWTLMWSNSNQSPAGLLRVHFKTQSATNETRGNVSQSFSPLLDLVHACFFFLCVCFQFVCLLSVFVCGRWFIHHSIKQAILTWLSADVPHTVSAEVGWCSSTSCSAVEDWLD